MGTIGFLDQPVVTPAAQALCDEDVEEVGYVMNVSRLWGYNPDLMTGLFDLMRQATAGYDLSLRDRGILVAACASTLGDSYCSVAWGSKLAAVSDPAIAAAVIQGGDEGLSDREQALAAWARKMTGDPNGTNDDDVDALRSVGFTDPQVFAITAFVALRLAFSTLNDALGVGPDMMLCAAAPDAVLSAVGYGRPPMEHAD
jgi:uncharacterized peroxidase-related enzyme